MSKIALEIRKNDRERCWDMYILNEHAASFGAGYNPAIVYDTRWQRLIWFCEKNHARPENILYYSYDEIEGVYP